MQKLITGLLSCVALLLATGTALAGKGDTVENKIPYVSQVMVDESVVGETKLYIWGSNLQVVEDGVIVEDATATLPLGAPDSVSTVSCDDLTMAACDIVAVFPYDVSPGDYLLTISHAKGTIGYELTVGAIGLQGPQGDIGPQGDQGIQGMTGDPGADGAAGPQGDQGPQGDKGDKGDTGDQGIQGMTGANGADGADGAAATCPCRVAFYAVAAARWYPGASLVQCIVYDVPDPNRGVYDYSGWLLRAAVQSTDPAYTLLFADNRYELISASPREGSNVSSKCSATSGGNNKVKPINFVVHDLSVEEVEACDVELFLTAAAMAACINDF